MLLGWCVECGGVLMAGIKKKRMRFLRILFFGDPLGARTQDPNIKSVVLYQLS